MNITPLPTPLELRRSLPAPRPALDHIASARQTIRAILAGRDQRLLAIVGPCSIHDPEAALDYAGALRELADRHREHLFVVMRTYFEKPRTTIGWRGLINDPHLDGSCDMRTGLLRARRLLLDCAELGLPCATETLDATVPQYLADLVSWTAIGARTTESQSHRDLASGLSMPVGFKNGTDGGLAIAINAMLAAANPSSFLGIDEHGRAGVVHTYGNPHTHIVLRGGDRGPNHDAAAVGTAIAALRAAALRERVLVDCSHGNCGRDHLRQLVVAEDLAAQIDAGNEAILGVMLESNTVAGRQRHDGRAALCRGQSITDPCVDLAQTASILGRLAAAVARRTIPVPI